MGLVTLVVLVAALSVLVLGLRAAVDGTPSLMSGMWGHRELGWPSGVQEDDDMHWSWVGKATRPGHAPRSPVREVTRADDARERQPALEVGLTPLRYEVHSRDTAR